MNVLSLHAANPGPYTGAGNWTYLIPGDRPLLIDAGVGKAEHLEAIAAAVAAGPARVLVTHAHPDHASGAPALAARWPSAAFSKMPWPGEDIETLVWSPLVDGERIATGEGDLEVVHTPGHAPDHVVLWHEASRTIFGADLMQLGTRWPSRRRKAATWRPTCARCGGCRRCGRRACCRRMARSSTIRWRSSIST